MLSRVEVEDNHGWSTPGHNWPTPGHLWPISNLWERTTKMGWPTPGHHCCSRQGAYSRPPPLAYFSASPSLLLAWCQSISCRRLWGPILRYWVMC